MFYIPPRNIFLSLDWPDISPTHHEYSVSRAIEKKHQHPHITYHISAYSLSSIKEAGVPTSPVHWETARHKASLLSPLSPFLLRQQVATKQLKMLRPQINFLFSQQREGRWLASFYFPSFCSLVRPPALTMKTWRIVQVASPRTGKTKVESPQSSLLEVRFI